MFDAAGIPLPEEPQPPLHLQLIHMQQQVNTLTQTMAGLVTHLQQPPAPAVPATPLPPASSGPLCSYRHAVVSDHYGGYPDRCHQFVLACELYFMDYPQMSSHEKVTFIWCLTGWVYDWAEAIWRQDRVLTMPYCEFLAQFLELRSCPLA